VCGYSLGILRSQRVKHVMCFIVFTFFFFVLKQQSLSLQFCAFILLYILKADADLIYL
jgi:hypothetical protein